MRAAPTSDEIGDTQMSGEMPDPLASEVAQSQTLQSDLRLAEIVGRPKVNKAGLIVTSELGIAIARCKRKVQKLARECRRANRRFR